MENLKVKLTIILSFLSYITVVSQNDMKILEAFSESYKAETGENYSVAISSLKSVYRADDYAINVRLGWLLLLTKQYTESVSFYDKAIRLKPYAIEARFGMIKALNSLESWDQVKEHYEAILKIDPQNTTSLYWLGILLYNRKDFDNAAKNFEKIVNLYPMDYGSVIMLAWTRLYQGKKLDAKVLFNHALLLSPNDASATSGLNLLK
jgi:tetratricopeptide (TPR) repeat protein